MDVDYETAHRIIDQYVSDVKAELPIDKVYLYGSYANGTAQWENKHICLEPNAFPTSELHNDNPFVKEILRTGTEILSPP